MTPDVLIPKFSIPSTSVCMTAFTGSTGLLTAAREHLACDMTSCATLEVGTIPAADAILCQRICNASKCQSVKRSWVSSSAHFHLLPPMQRLSNLLLLPS